MKTPRAKAIGFSGHAHANPSRYVGLLIGLHVVQRRRYGRLGVAGFATVHVGYMLIIAGSVGEFWIFSEQAYALPNGRNASWALFLPLFGWSSNPGDR